MKTIKLRYFKPQATATKSTKTKALKGHISKTGSLFLPLELNFGDSMFSKVATSKDSQSITSLYIAPTSNPDEFPIKQTKKSYAINIESVLAEDGLDYKTGKLTFTIDTIQIRNQTYYELNFDAPKKPYTGKPRGKKKAQPAE